MARHKKSKPRPKPKKSEHHPTDEAVKDYIEGINILCGPDTSCPWELLLEAAHAIKDLNGSQGKGTIHQELVDTAWRIKEAHRQIVQNWDESTARRMAAEGNRQSYFFDQLGSAVTKPR